MKKKKDAVDEDNFVAVAVVVVVPGVFVHSLVA